MLNLSKEKFAYNLDINLLLLQKFSEEIEELFNFLENISILELKQPIKRKIKHWMVSTRDSEHNNLSLILKPRKQKPIFKEKPTQEEDLSLISSTPFAKQIFADN